LDFWERPSHPSEIDEQTVEKAVPLDRLAEDMETDFQGLFPRHSELRFLAVKVMTYLQEHGPQKQSKLVVELGVERSAMSRLLTKLESAKRITRNREGGTDKIVYLRPQ
jgi:DNA-binding MarR family transcriptional regulator